ncbi:MAG: flagellar basal-body MS-ring/collar protein FliF [Candidatus Krumholzibacteriia bacterium]
MTGVRDVIARFGRGLQGLSFGQRVVLGGVAVAALVSMTVFGLWLGREEQAVLFANLGPADASAALEELAKLDVPARLANGGTTVMVPASRVHRLRVDLAARGIPAASTVGFEIFDGQQYGLTEFLQNVNFKRALEGELTKSIETLQGIESARVHLVLPKPSIFRREESAATASVVLRLERMARPSESQIAGIRSLVAGSVEALTPEHVTVIDQHGKELSPAYADDSVGRSEGQLALKKEVEFHLTEKAQSMLGEVLGPDRAIVRVDATLNFEKLDREREIFDPQGAVVRSEERQETSETQSGANDESSVTNYEINRTVERVVGETGGVKALSVAVFVDGVWAAPEGGGEPVYRPLPDDELNQIRRIVATAVGLNSVRGDQIEVVNMPFSNRRDAPTSGGVPATRWLELVPQYGGRLFLLALLVGLLLSFRRNLERVLAEVFPARRTAGGGEAVAPPERFEGLPDMTDQMIEDVQEYAAENPDRVAEVIQSWIYEEDWNREQRSRSMGGAA